MGLAYIDRHQRQFQRVDYAVARRNVDGKRSRAEVPNVPIEWKDLVCVAKVPTGADWAACDAGCKADGAACAQACTFREVDGVCLLSAVCQTDPGECLPHPGSPVTVSL